MKINEIVINEKRRFIVKDWGNVISIEREFKGVIKNHILIDAQNLDENIDYIKNNGKFFPQMIFNGCA